MNGSSIRLRLLFSLLGSAHAQRQAQRRRDDRGSRVASRARSAATGSGWRRWRRATRIRISSKPKPSFILKLQRADLLIVVGRELEVGWLPPLIQQSRNAKIQPGRDGLLDASLNVRILEIPTGQITRAMGDVHPLGNPHYWLDPGNGRRIAQADRRASWRAARRRRAVLRPAAMPISTGGCRGARSGGTPRWRRTRARRSSPITGRGRTSPTASAWT